MKRTVAIAAVVLLSISTIGYLSQTSHSQVSGESQNIVVHLSSYSDDLHAAFMAVKLATALRKSGASVGLFLDLEGVRMADNRVPLDVMWGTAHAPLSKHFEDFVSAGGTVLLCPHCAEAAGITKEHLRKGAFITRDDEVVAMLVEADKILDY